MQYTQLGRSGLKVSRLCLGTMNFGPQTEEADARAIMDSALGAGINFFAGCGPPHQAQLDSALRAMDLALDSGALRRLDDIFPGHRTAPEDYAW